MSELDSNKKLDSNKVIIPSSDEPTEEREKKLSGGPTEEREKKQSDGPTEEREKHSDGPTEESEKKQSNGPTEEREKQSDGPREEREKKLDPKSRTINKEKLKKPCDGTTEEREKKLDPKSRTINKEKLKKPCCHSLKKERQMLKELWDAHTKRLKLGPDDNVEKNNELMDSALSLPGSALPEGSINSNSSQREVTSASNNLNTHSTDQTFMPVTSDSRKDGQKEFCRMIRPYSLDRFFKNYWETKPLLVERENYEYNKDLITIPIIDSMLQNRNIQYSKNIIIIEKTGIIRNMEGRAFPHAIWQAYSEEKCSITLLNPQTYIHKLHKLIASIQEFFNSYVGVKAHLTPSGIVEHRIEYNTEETFIIQIEGKKHWQIYRPTVEKRLPMHNDNKESTKYYIRKELGDPYLEAILCAGDFLYIPRGFGYRGSTLGGGHSLHVTISVNRKHTWGDLFENVMSTVVKRAIAENIDLRRSIPPDFFDNCGLVHANLLWHRKEQIKSMADSLFDKIKNAFSLDEAADQMHKIYQHAALPPALTTCEKAVTVFGDSEQMIQDGVITQRVDSNTKIRLLRRSGIRIVFEDNETRLYYYAGNSMETHQYPLAFFAIRRSFSSAILDLTYAYPKYIKVSQLKIRRKSDQLHFVNELWSRGIIMTEYPMNMKIMKENDSNGGIS